MIENYKALLKPEEEELLSKYVLTCSWVSKKPKIRWKLHAIWVHYPTLTVIESESGDGASEDIIHLCQ